MDLSLNVANSSSRKNSVKTDNTKLQKLSNNQSVNPSFNFSWDTKTAAQSKAFRKKKHAPQTQTNVVVSQKVAKPSAKTTDKPAKTITDTPAEIHHSESHENTSKFNIKRKHKKDKQKLQNSKDLIDAAETNDSTAVSVKPHQKTYPLFNEPRKPVYIKPSSGKSIKEKVFANSGKTFSELPIHKYLVSNLEKIQFTTLTNVQEKAIPVVLSGSDVLIRSQTGSGKTLVYAVPIIDALQSITPRIRRVDGVQAIIVVPTRELALQTHELFSKINTFQWLVVGHLCGGESRKSEKERLRKGINVLIGTPGRLLDHVLHTSSLNLDKVRCLVLDEADRLLDMGFRKDIISLVEALNSAKESKQYDPMKLLKSASNNSEETEEESTTNVENTFPLRDIHNNNRQTILLSATLTTSVSELANFAMSEHIYIDALDEDSDNKMNSDSLIIPDTVKQEFVLTYVKHRLFTLSALIVEKCKQNSKVFIFMASTQMVEFHYDLFNECLLKMPKNRGKVKSGNVVLYDGEEEDSEDEEEIVLDTQFYKLHGSMDQKMRREVFTAFRAAKKGILLCTDVAARGVDVPEADCIVQYTGPQTDEDYLHRVGRTGRAGRSGLAILFITHEEQDYISRLKEHGIFLKKRHPDDVVKHLCELMEEPDTERAAEALQRRYESVVARNKALHTTACFGYSTWSRFYNSYPAKMRTIFDFKKINLGHYATSFALKDTPSQISKVVRGEVGNVEAPRLNRKLEIHKDDEAPKSQLKKKKRRNDNLVNSEYSSGLEPSKKKKKKNKFEDE